MVVFVQNIGGGKHCASGYSEQAFLMIAVKPRASRLAPPTSAPSMSGLERSSLAFSGLTLPPYWMRIRSEAAALNFVLKTLRIHWWAS